MKKGLEVQICARIAKIGLEISFFCHFLKFGLSVFLEIVQDDVLVQCLTSSRGKTRKKNFGGPNLCQTSQNWAQN